MSFVALHSLVTYALVACGFGAVAASGEIPPVLLGAFFGAMVWSLFQGERRSEATPWVWTAVLLAVLALLVAEGFSSGNWLANALYFSLFLTASKLFQRRQAKDYAQLYSLSFLLLLAGSVMNPGLSFALIFVLYTVLLTWALVLLHLRRDVEDGQAALMALGLAEVAAPGGDASRALWRARTLLTPKFLLGTSLLAVLIFVASVVVFFLFPRVGLGLFFASGREGQSVAGFSSRVELGHFGTIKDNPRVIARVELPDRSGPPEVPLRLRGISFDHYDGRMWSRQIKLPVRREMPIGPEGERIAHINKDRGWPARRLRQRVYLEPFDTDVRVLFGVPLMRSLRVPSAEAAPLAMKPRRYFQEDPSGDIVYTGRLEGGVVYDVDSEIPKGVPPGIRSAGTDIPHLVQLAYLQLPELSPRVGELAAEMALGADNPFDKARAIEAALREGYGYTRTGNHDPADPLMDFLFGRKEGHCEFFASAMVVLLRTQGIPARMVNGFLGGLWNGVGEYIEVRQGDAHAWVEAYFPGYGWWTFDPTPPGGQLAPEDTGFLTVFDRFMDAMKLQWYKWVVEYNLEKQIDLFRELGRSVAQALGGGSEQENNAKSGAKKQSLRDLLRNIDMRRVLIPLALILAIGGGIFWFLRRQSQPNDQRAPLHHDAERARRYWLAVLKLGQKRGLLAGTNVTVGDVLLAAQRVPGAPVSALVRAARAYEAARFGGAGLDHEGEAALQHAVSALRAWRPVA
jgi:transglutaminase-like putative cysteine protease